MAKASPRETSSGRSSESKPKAGLRSGENRQHGHREHRGPAGADYRNRLFFNMYNGENGGATIQIIASITKDFY